jgi:hypothetical protein
MPEWLLPTLAFVGGAFGTWILIRLRFERFEAMDTRREQDWKEWRMDVNNDRKEAREKIAKLESAVHYLQEWVRQHDNDPR